MNIEPGLAQTGG